MKATISRTSPRYQNWLDVFGSDTVEILAPAPVLAIGPTGPDLFYRADISRLTAAQRARLVRFLSQRWHISPVDAAKTIDDPEHGVPIHASDVTVQGALW